MSSSKKNLKTQAIHTGRTTDPATGAIASPIHLSTTFERAADGSYPHEFVYTRESNPNRQELETCLAQLEQGERAFVFSSGSAAIGSLLLGLGASDHVIASEDMYFGIQMILKTIFGRWNLSVSFVDTTDPASVKAALQSNTRLVMLETPSNPLLKLTDIRTIADVVHANGTALMVDNTAATPVLQNPLPLGADIVAHATTKYINGHSDVLGGALVFGQADHPLAERVMQIQHLMGAVPSPFDMWLTLRGIATLPYRMRGHCDNAATVAAYLTTHPQIEQVLYPGLSTYEGHEIAIGQMPNGFGGLMSILVKGDASDAMRVASKVQLFTRATSFGGAHSLIEHRASIEHPETTTPQNLLRLSIGLENADDLIHDLEQALAD